MIKKKLSASESWLKILLITGSLAYRAVIATSNCLLGAAYGSLLAYLLVWVFSLDSNITHAICASLGAYLYVREQD